MKYLFEAGLKRAIELEGDEVRPVDVHDQAAADNTAVWLEFPDFNERTEAVLSYLDDTAFLFWYKGKLIITDESLYLTAAGDGKTTPLGFPRWEGETVEEMKDWLEAVYNDLVENEVIDPVA